MTDQEIRGSLANTLTRLRNEIARLRLTDEERAALELFASLNWTGTRWSAVEKHAAALRNLLERLS